MVSEYLNPLYRLEVKTAVITGGGGHLCSEIAFGFSKAGANIAIFDLRSENERQKVILGKYVDL